MVSSMDIPKRMFIIVIPAKFLLHYSFKGISLQYIEQESNIRIHFFHNELSQQQSNFYENI